MHDSSSGGPQMMPPECEKKGCKNKAFVAIDGIWLCGDCIVKYKNIKKEFFKKMLNK